MMRSVEFRFLFTAVILRRQDAHLMEEEYFQIHHLIYLPFYYLQINYASHLFYHSACKKEASIIDENFNQRFT